MATEIRAMGRKAVCLQADLLDEDAIAPLVPDAAMALGGPISVLVNNASIFRAGQHRHCYPAKLGQAYDEQPARALLC